jgi:hypothetical protein
MGFEYIVDFLVSVGATVNKQNLVPYDAFISVIHLFSFVLCRMGIQPYIGLAT